MLLGLDLCPLAYPTNSGFLCSVFKFLKSSSVTQDDEPVITLEVFSEPKSEEINCSAQHRGLTILNTLPYQRKEGVPLASSTAQGSLFSSRGPQGGDVS